LTVFVTYNNCRQIFICGATLFSAFGATNINNYVLMVKNVEVHQIVWFSSAIYLLFCTTKLHVVGVLRMSKIWLIVYDIQCTMLGSVMNKRTFFYLWQAPTFYQVKFWSQKAFCTCIKHMTNQRRATEVYQLTL